MLAKPALLADLTDYLEHAPPTVDDLYETAERYARSPRRVPSAVNFNQFLGTFSEYLYRVRLERACGDAADRVVFDPVPAFSRSSQYVFAPVKGRLVAIRRDTHRYACEYDFLALVDETPVIFEIKLVRGKSGGGRKSKKGRSSQFTPHLRDESVGAITTPLEDYYGLRCACVFVTYPHNVSAGNPVQARFRARNGVIVAHHAGRHQYLQEMADLAEALRL